MSSRTLSNFMIAYKTSFKHLTSIISVIIKYYIIFKKSFEQNSDKALWFYTKYNTNY